MGNAVDTTATNTSVALQQAWANLVDFVPRALAFVITLLIGWFIAQMIGTLCRKALRRIGFDNFVERGGIRQALANTGWDAAEIVGKVVTFTVFLFVLQLGFGFFGPNPISALLTRMIAFLPNVFVALAIVVISAYIASMVKQLVFAALGGLNYGRTIAMASYAAIMIVGAFAALNQVGIAPEIVNGVFYAMLAIITGVCIVAIGGGGIQPMRNQWEKWLNKAETEMPRIRQQLETPERVSVVREGPYTA